ncbi:hypothetical protein EBX93_03905 [bacterium]|nr:hypothetical protein [bacterium]
MQPLISRSFGPFKISGLLLLLWIVSFIFSHQGSFSRAQEKQPYKSSNLPKQETNHPAISTSASCSGRGCHGGSEPVTGQIVQQNEFSSWLAHDKHANAYQALLSDRAKTMAKNLGITEAHKDIRCLACHTTPQIAREQAKVDSPLDLGVGCESCHGSASSKWLGIHTTEAWKNSPIKEKKALYENEGMIYLGNPVVQTQVCVGCHVGAPENTTTGIPARDANHDIMAAGHPRLTFESLSYQANMPPHWNTKKYSSNSNRDLEIWVAGQIAGLSATMELSSHRAQLAINNSGAWPEFAESSCISCHADFQQPSWRGNKNYYSGRKPGSLPFDSWTGVLLPEALAISGQDKQMTAVYSDFLKSRNSFLTSPKQAKAASDILASQLQKIQKELIVNGINPPKEWRKLLLDQLARRDLETASWNESTQIALALSLISSKANEQANLQNLWETLAFPSGYESPKDYKPSSRILQEFIQKLKTNK